MHGFSSPRRVAALLLAAVFAAPSAALAQTPKPSMAEALAAIEAYAPQAMQEQGTPGLAIAITDRTHTLRVITLGYANVDTQAPVTAQTRFAIGSLTKSMTAAALLQFYDRKRLDLDAPVTRYLPWFSIRSDGKPVLVHQLLSHTAGLPDDYTAVLGFTYSVAALRDAHTLFPPGEGWSYSNDGYATAGALLERLSGMPWAQTIERHVFAPLGMVHASPIFTPQTMANAATGYEYRDFDRPPSEHPPLTPTRLMDFVDPAGSVLATPEDMARYVRLLLGGGRTPGGTRLLSPRAFALWTSPDRLSNGKPAGSPSVVLDEAPHMYRGYGFGLSVSNHDGDKIVGHTGGIAGYTACMQANLTRGFGAVAMANLVEGPLHPCAIVLYAMRVLQAQSRGEQLPAMPAPKDRAYVARASDYIGTFASPDGRTLVVTGSAHRLALHDGLRTFAMYPRGDDMFWTDDPRYALFLLAFGRNRDHRVDELTYGGVWFAGASYDGPRSWAHPHNYDALLGRYETDFWGSPAEERVVLLKGRLTLEGLSPLIERADGGFTAGSSTVRFDTPAEGQMQRMWFDGIPLYRIELP